MRAMDELRKQVEREFASSMDFIEAEPLGPTRFTAEDVCLHLGINTDILDLCIRWQVVEPEPAEGITGVFSDTAVERVRRAVRLHYDLGVNWPGVAVLLDVLDRLDRLERELRDRSSDD
jgi:chaperone modulatory protein CbpM